MSLASYEYKMLVPSASAIVSTDEAVDIQRIGATFNGALQRFERDIHLIGFTLPLGIVRIEMSTETAQRLQHRLAVADLRVLRQVAHQSHHEMQRSLSRYVLAELGASTSSRF